MRNRSVMVFFIALSVLILTSTASAEQVSFSLVQEADQVIVFVKNARDLGAFEIELSSDQGFIVDRIQKGNLLDTTFRTFSLVGPKVDPAGKLKFGFFSTGYDEGVNGGGALAEIKIKSDPSSIKITNIKATDSRGKKVFCTFQISPRPGWGHLGRWE
jgi:hypothetical protein